MVHPRANNTARDIELANNTDRDIILANNMLANIQQWRMLFYHQEIQCVIFLGACRSLNIDIYEYCNIFCHSFCDQKFSFQLLVLFSSWKIQLNSIQLGKMLFTDIFHLHFSKLRLDLSHPLQSDLQKHSNV